MTTAVRRRYAPGALVRVRGRDWVVLPSERQDVLRLRPLTGGNEAETGIFLPFEGHEVTPTELSLPDPSRAGTTDGAVLLADAARLNLRSGAAPFRSLGRIAVRPRPYQFVPLIMALRQDPVRLLIADDVGVGKTIEAGLIARELLERGQAQRLAVVCPAHLCDQWEAELRDKFGIDAAVIQPSRIARLERDLPRADVSIYQYYRHLIVSIDYVKSDRNRPFFLDHVPDLVIVDEAHIAARPRGDSDRSQHQRHNLVHQLAQQSARHLVLVTATPHSGIEESYRSLLGFLDPAFDTSERGVERERLIPHVVQRQRRDLTRWLGTETPFPERLPEERTYPLSQPYRALFDDVLVYCRETIQTSPGDERAHQRRVRHWGAIALLRCLLSSPDAAASVLQNRARRQGLGEDLFSVGRDEDVDEVYRPQVMDLTDQEASADYAPAAPLEDPEANYTDRERRRLRDFLSRALELRGPKHDRKLTETADALSEMLDEEYQPIVYCRFIPTAKYLAQWLPRLLGDQFPGLRVQAVTGEIGDQERRAMVEELAKERIRVLVATDCLSEGINLQEHFNAVLHYDLPWNPNRLEQREGRVDRFGQARKTVRATLLHSPENPVDSVVLRALIHKAAEIRRDLGVAVPVPVDAELVIESLVDNILLQPGGSTAVQLEMGLQSPRVSRLHEAWDAAADRERRQRAFFAQRGIKPDEVARELEATDPVLGDPEAVERFLQDAAQRLNGDLRPARAPGQYRLDPGDLRVDLAARGFTESLFTLRLDGLHEPGVISVGRTHPIVATFCDAVLRGALDDEGHTRFPRCGAAYTSAVARRTGVALLRVRYRMREEETDQFAEEILLTAFQRRDGQLTWLEPYPEAGRELLHQARDAVVDNMPAEDKAAQVNWGLDLLQGDRAALPVIDSRVSQLKESHSRLRRLVRGGRLTVEPYPPDVLGCFVLVPGGQR